MTRAADIPRIRDQVDKIVASGVLGRSKFYSALLGYLAECSESGHAPKEIEIAAEVFSRGAGFDPAQDSMVRVYAHNLRQKIEQFYAGPGADEAEQISIPKGEYRLALVAPATSLPAAAGGSKPGLVRVAVIVAVSLLGGMLLDHLLLGEPGTVQAALEDVASTSLWQPITDDDLPVTIVVGDYFIFGEFDEIGNVGRLVREFSINSSRDLDERFMLEPDTAERYIDLDLTYLPSSIAPAMRDLVGVLTAAGKEIRVVAMSNLDTAVIRETHVLYVGFLSGLGMLSDFVFAGSELVVGDTYDELVDQATGKTYVSEAGLPTGQSYRDYGLFSTMPGPGGNQLVFVAGTRDEGLMQTAQAISDADMARISVAAVAPDGDVPPAYELLFEVAGLGRTNLDAMIVHAAELNRERLSIGQLTP